MKLFHRDHDDVVGENIGHEYDDDDDGDAEDVTCRQHVETQYQSTGDKIELLESQVYSVTLTQDLTYRVFFLTGPPLKSFKYRKVDLG